MKILNFASANVDYVYSVSHIVRPGETISAPKMEIFPGGKGLNQSVAAARAGGNIYHAGFVGTDGGLLEDILANSGVKLDFLCRADSKNGHAIIQVNEQAENSIVIYQGTNGMFSKEYIDNVLGAFDAGDYAMVQNEVNNLPYIIEKAYEKGLQIVFNPSPFDDRLRNLELSKISYLILNETEAAGFFGTDDVSQIAEHMRQQFPKMKMVLTLGSKGCVYVDAEAEIFCPAFQVQPVDTTAAGDTFTGYFVAQLAAGKTVSRALKVSCAASAIAVSAMGAAPSIPVMAVVCKSMNSLKPYRMDNGKHRADRQKIHDLILGDLENSSLHVLAKKLGYSVSYTGILVKKVCGKSFINLLHELRCHQAQELLKETDLPVGSIIKQVGYNNESFFRNKFKEFYGVSPLEYRKKEK